MSNLPLAPDTVPVRDAHKFDLNALDKYLQVEIPDFGAIKSIRQFEGGQSNPTFIIESQDRRYVLRKKPKGELLVSAHQVEREYRIMKALAQTEFPVPKCILLCENPEIIGTNFFIMDYIEGRILRDPKLPELASSERANIYSNMCNTLAQLHLLDWEKLGLEDFGRRDSYLARQITRWSIAYEATRGIEIPSMEKLMDWLGKHIPAEDPTAPQITIAHGDFRLENLIFHSAEPKVVAVLDWELSTLGHPLGDLAYCCIPYHLPSTIEGLPGLQGLDLGTLGIPEEKQFVSNYAKLTGRETIQDFRFFIVFSLFRLASIAQGVKHRATLGVASSEKAEKIGGLAKLFADIAWRLANTL
jgi:aminoglycoside phosphotransferase (APT) family kinase protein